MFTVKCNGDGGIQINKARLVVKCFTQTYLIDYQKTFAHVAKINFIKILLSLATNLDLSHHQLDVKNVFLAMI